jgi:virginiamycin B lyase
MKCPKTKLLLLAFILAFAATTTPYHVLVVSAQAVQIRYYPVPTPHGAPRAITVDSAGNVWFTEDNLTINKIGVLTPSNGSIREYPIPSPQAEARSITVSPNGTVWFAEHGANKIGALSPATGRITEWPIFAEDGWGRPEGGIGFDSTSHLWFIEPIAWDIKGIGSVDSLDPRSGNVTKYPAPTCTAINSLNQTDILSILTALLVDRHDDVWFTDTTCNWVGRLTPGNAHFTLYPLPFIRKLWTPGPGLGDWGGLTLDQTGKLWFTEDYVHKIGMLDPSTGLVKEWALSAPSNITGGPTNLALDSKGHVWFTQACETPSGDWTTCNLTMLDPASGVLFNYALRGDVRMTWGIAVDAEDNVWVAGQGWNSIVEVVAASSETSSATASTATANSSVTSVTETGLNATSVSLPEYSSSAVILTAITTIVTVAVMVARRKRKAAVQIERFSNP